VTPHAPSGYDVHALEYVPPPDGSCPISEALQAPAPPLDPVEPLELEELVPELEPELVPELEPELLFPPVPPSDVLLLDEHATIAEMAKTEADAMAWRRSDTFS